MDFLEYADPLASDLRPGVVCRVSTVSRLRRVQAARHARALTATATCRTSTVPDLSSRGDGTARAAWSRFEHIRRAIPVTPLIIALFEAPPARRRRRRRPRRPRAGLRVRTSFRYASVIALAPRDGARVAAGEAARARPRARTSRARGGSGAMAKMPAGAAAREAAPEPRARGMAHGRARHSHRLGARRRHGPAPLRLSGSRSRRASAPGGGGAGRRGARRIALTTG